MLENGYLLVHSDCLTALRQLPDNSVDSIVTDPPYGLSFMGKKWDYDVPGVDVWAECLRVLKPGGHLLAFAGTRTQHRMAVRIEDAGFEIRDMIAWVYGSGFPKSLDVSKAIDKMDAAEAHRARKLRFTEWVRATGLTAFEIDRITEWVRATGLTAFEIDRITGTNMGGRYTTAASQPAVATREHFEKLRPHLGADVPEWVEQMVDERTVESENFKRREVLRTVTGKDTSLQRPGIPLQDSSAKREYSVTAAHTEAARQWQGWGTALKPALEPITVARKPLVGTVAANVLAHGTGALNIDGCRVGTESTRRADCAQMFSKGGVRDDNGNPALNRSATGSDSGRWPANLIHDGSDEVAAQFPETKSGGYPPEGGQRSQVATYGKPTARGEQKFTSSEGSARFFYCAKASKSDRGAENNHPTVKPTELMRYLVRLVTPPGGVVLDPFMGSGSTGKAAILEGFRFIGIDMTAEYVEIARARIQYVTGEDLC